MNSRKRTRKEVSRCELVNEKKGLEKDMSVREIEEVRKIERKI
jgi:hypothetical protein